MISNQKFYEKTWFVVVMLFLFFPVGLFLMWKYKKFGQVLRIIITFVFAIFFIIVITTPKDESNSIQTNNSQNEKDNSKVVATQKITPTSKPTATLKPTATPTPKLTKEQIKAKKKAKAKRIKAEKKAKAKKAYKEWVESQFSLWDGSSKSLVDLVKENMNDPDSFKHVETRYRDEGLGKGITIYMVYRGKNAFGGVVKNSVTAFCDYKKNTIQITATNE